MPTDEDGHAHSTMEEMLKLCLLAATVAALVLTASSFATPSRTARSLSDSHVGTSRQELLRQRDYSERVIQALAGSWKVAPRHRTCWSHVPWHRTCDQARRRLIAQRWLYSLAKHRLVKLYPPKRAPTLGQAWLVHAFLCIHRYEGAWNDDTGNGYYGGLQFDRGSWLTNGGGQYAPTANLATPAEQIAVAITYYSKSGFKPWPNTAHMCGLL